MTPDEMLDQFYDQMEQRPDVRNEFLFWYFDCILPTMPADCVRFGDFSDWTEVETVAYQTSLN